MAQLQFPVTALLPSPLASIPTLFLSLYHHVSLSLLPPLPPNCVLYGLYCVPLQLCLLPCISFRPIILLPVTSYFLVTSSASPSLDFFTILFFLTDLSTALPTSPCPPPPPHLLPYLFSPLGLLPLVSLNTFMSLVLISFLLPPLPCSLSPPVLPYL